MLLLIISNQQFSIAMMKINFIKLAADILSQYNLEWILIIRSIN